MLRELWRTLDEHWSNFFELLSSTVDFNKGCVIPISLKDFEKLGEGSAAVFVRAELSPRGPSGRGWPFGLAAVSWKLRGRTRSLDADHQVVMP